jgi:hypothetical protein
MADPLQTPTQAEADSFKLQCHGHEADAEPPKVVDLPAVTVNGSVVASCAVGDMLAVTKGNWEGEPTAYWESWLAGSALVGNGPTYTAQPGDEGQSVRCSVTATNAVGSTNAISNAVMVAAARR